MKRFFYNIIVTVYILIAIITTVFLLSYNDFRVTEIGNKTLIIINEVNAVEGFDKGDLVVVDKGTKKELNVGDEVFFYYASRLQNEISCATITAKESITSTETTYTLEGDYNISSQYVIGKLNGAVQVPVVGGILEILESKWGFLFLIVFPSLIAFVYEIITVISEMRSGKKKK